MLPEKVIWLRVSITLHSCNSRQKKQTGYEILTSQHTFDLNSHKLCIPYSIIPTRLIHRIRTFPGTKNGRILMLRYKIFCRVKEKSYALLIDM